MLLFLPSRRKSVPAWKRRAKTSSTRMMHLPLPAAPSGRRLARELPHPLPPLVARDLDAIALWMLDYAGPEAGERKLAEIEAAFVTLKATPHKGSIRGEISHGLRAIPAGRKAVVAFAVDDVAAEVPIYAITYGGADWAMRSTARIR
jgi:toxin ParE1/3/4